MPAKWFLGKDGERVDFEAAPAYFESKGIMPGFAIEAILREIQGKKPAFHVRPSDVVPSMTCRRQRVWEQTNDFGVNPLDEEPTLEGDFWHRGLGTAEVKVPLPKYIEHPVEGSTIDVSPQRLPVCGVPMKGKIDWLTPTLITDLKTKTPFFYAQYAPKGSGGRPFVVLWEPDPKVEIEKWQLQLSIYAVLLEKSGQTPPQHGRVWQRNSGVKWTEFVRWRRFDFPLLTEIELDRKVGDWMRVLQRALDAAKTDPEAWKQAPADGLAFVGKRGNKWACDRCPLRIECNNLEGMDVW